jgi:protein TonB
MRRGTIAFWLSVVLLSPSVVAAQLELSADQTSAVQAMDAENPPEGFVAPRLDQPRPFTLNDYPADAFFDAVEGLAALRVLVREDGAIGDIQVVTSSGAAILDNKAIELTKLRHYTPATANGQPVAAWIRVNYDFKIPAVARTITPESTIFMGIQRGRPVTRKAYPAESLQAGEQGTVRIRYRVTADCKFTDPEILQSSGHARLDQVAVAMVLSGFCIPGKGTRRETRGREDVTFKLQ